MMGAPPVTRTLRRRHDGHLRPQSPSSVLSGHTSKGSSRAGRPKKSRAAEEPADARLVRLVSRLVRRAAQKGATRLRPSEPGGGSDSPNTIQQHRTSPPSRRGDPLSLVMDRSKDINGPSASSVVNSRSGSSFATSVVNSRNGSSFATSVVNSRNGSSVVSRKSNKKVRGIKAIIPSQDDADPESKVTCSSNEHIMSVFDEWTPEQVREVIHSEPLRARLYRKIAIVAGLNRPLGQRDYRKALRKFDGEECEMQAKYPVTHVEEMSTGYQVNSTELPFDTYQLFKESRRIFILLLVALYFTVLSTVFTLLAWGTSCLEIDLTFWNFLPAGFLLLSGLGENIFNGTRDTCMIVHSFAVLVGVYVSLPIIGAIVLVRLLDNKASLIVCTDVILLNVRNGIPEVVVRLSSASGGMLRNVKVESHVYLKTYDTTNENHYLMQHPVEFLAPHKLGHYPSFVKHYCTDDSPLIKQGAIEIDEVSTNSSVLTNKNVSHIYLQFGVPSWNPEKVAFISLSFDADGSKGCDRMFGYHPKTFIQPNRKGQMPFFVNSCPVSHFHWLKYKGQVSPLSDLSRLSKWEYQEREFRI